MDNSRIERIFFDLLQCEIVGKSINSDELLKLSEEDWRILYRMASAQGVLAIVYDALLPFIGLLPRGLKIQWALGVEQIEKRYYRQAKYAKELSAVYSKNGIRVVVLKGLAISLYYPNHSHRECGDFDCFLFDKFEQGNRIAEQSGAHICGSDYKHSHIEYKGLMVENHKFCTPIRGPRINKEFERYLQKLLREAPEKYLDGSTIILPSALFNTLFLSRHAMTHFLYEGLTIRHAVDWACLLAKEQNNIEWEEFYKWCDRLHLTTFVNTLNAVVERYIGIKISNPKIVIDNKYADKFIACMLYEGNSVYNQSNISLWSQRRKIVGNMISGHWKYSKIYKRSLVTSCLSAAYGVLFEKNPKL